ncbi:palmitoyltransferase app [Anaeramoeba flamelloides]|uniref:Palmitoyltransferase n=1 Tax=Anaeramoeba flamelloides TaxID=1746091 RepID=A0ABQ8XLH4_9EUKA|nr:palmitoyltransferase app [Anaeramoeba flamelloides]
MNLIIHPIFIRQFYLELPNISTLNKQHSYLLLILLVCYLIAFVCASFSSPGIITKNNYMKYIKIYPNENQIYLPTVCSTCKLKQPARSNHCTFTNKCIAKYDHYCSWLMNPIGERNLRFFIFHLFVMLVLYCYYSFLCASILVFKLKMNGVFDFVYYNNKSDYTKDIGISLIFSFLDGECKAFFNFAIFFTLLSLITFALFANHCLKIIQNITTHENFIFIQLKTDLEKNNINNVKNNDHDQKIMKKNNKNNKKKKKKLRKKNVSIDKNTNNQSDGSQFTKKSQTTSTTSKSIMTRKKKKKKAYSNKFQKWDTK